jgi:hypothetical protein
LRVRIREFGEFLFRQPEVVATRLIALTFRADGLLQTGISFLHQAREDFKHLRAFRHGAVELLVGFRVVFDLDRAGLASFGRNFLPFTKRLLDGVERRLRILTGVFE